MCTRLCVTSPAGPASACNHRAPEGGLAVRVALQCCRPCGPGTVGDRLHHRHLHPAPGRADTAVAQGLQVRNSPVGQGVSMFVCSYFQVTCAWWLPREAGWHARSYTVRQRQRQWVSNQMLQAAGRLRVLTVAAASGLQERPAAQADAGGLHDRALWLCWASRYYLPSRPSACTATVAGPRHGNTQQHTATSLVASHCSVPSTPPPLAGPRLQHCWAAAVMCG